MVDSVRCAVTVFRYVDIIGTRKKFRQSDSSNFRRLEVREREQLGVANEEMTSMQKHQESERGSTTSTASNLVSTCSELRESQLRSISGATG